MKSRLFLALLLVACDVEPVSERQFEKREKQRADTTFMRAADITGYDGRKLRSSGAALINANRKRNEAIKQALQDD